MDQKNKFIAECFCFSPSQRNAFARCCGSSILKAPIDVLITFWGMYSNNFTLETPIWTEDIEARFFTACMISKFGRNAAESGGKISVQDALHNLYSSDCTDSLKSKIESVLTTPLDKTGQLCYRINGLVELMPKNTQNSLDFEKLYYDIRSWNAPVIGTSFAKNGARYIWAYKIVKHEKSKENTAEENTDM